MTTNVEHRAFQEKPNLDSTYAPDLLPLLQSLLADLADLDFAHERNLDTIRRSPVDEDVKRTMLAGLRQRHHQMRAPYVHELATLQKRIVATLAQ